MKNYFIGMMFVICTFDYAAESGKEVQDLCRQRASSPYPHSYVHMANGRCSGLGEGRFFPEDGGKRTPLLDFSRAPRIKDLEKENDQLWDHVEFLTKHAIELAYLCSELSARMFKVESNQDVFGKALAEADIINYEDTDDDEESDAAMQREFSPLPVPEQYDTYEDLAQCTGWKLAPPRACLQMRLVRSSSLSVLDPKTVRCLPECASERAVSEDGQIFSDED